MKQKFYDWYRLPTKTLRELQMYPEFILLKDNGRWSEVKPQCGEDKVVLLRTDRISYDVRMGALVSLIINKNFRIFIDAINMQYIQVGFIFPTDDAGFKTWTLESIEKYLNRDESKQRFCKDKCEPKDIEEEIAVIMKPKESEEVAATVESEEKGTLHVIEPK